MTVVFVHGVPEIPAIGDGVRRHSPGDSIALRLPGFGSARPEHPTGKDAYAGWLAEKLRAIGADRPWRFGADLPQWGAASS